jgi:flagellar L-ring protein precursor FlgH
MFTDIKAARVGDLLTVLVYEDAQASNQSALKTEEKSEASTKSSGGAGPLRFIPLFSADNASDATYDGKGENSRRGLLKGRMTVEVIAERANGDLVIQGSRVVTLNSDHQTMTLTGIIRRADINPDNTINSYSVADAHIVYTGKGPASDGSRPGLITRALNWIF